MWDRYFQVSTIEEALELLAEYGEQARVVAGATDLLLELEAGKHPNVHALIDITRVAGLDEINESDSDYTLGALVTHNQVVGHAGLVEYAPLLAQACWEVGAPQIRNRATIAGNVITGSPANDTIPPLLVLGATITLRSKQGTREVPIAEFYEGFRQTVMKPDELLTAIRVPKLKSNERGVFLKLGLRRAQAISIVNIAVVLEMNNTTIKDARITLGSVAPVVIHVPKTEKFLEGKTLTIDVMQEAARIAAREPKPIDDVRGTAEYRSEMVKILVLRALRAVADESEITSVPKQPAMLWGESQGQIPRVLATQHVHADDSEITCTINQEPHTINTGQEKSLLRWLREDVGLPGTKEGCAEGECGACTIFVDGVAVMACMVPAPRAHGTEIVTIEGLQDNGRLHPIQQAFIEEGAVQCGYCTPGFLMAGAKLLDEHPGPSLAQIQQSISGNLCRCTGYYKIIEAFRTASQQTIEE